MTLIVLVSTMAVLLMAMLLIVMLLIIVIWIAFKLSVIEQTFRLTGNEKVEKIGFVN